MATENDPLISNKKPKVTGSAFFFLTLSLYSGVLLAAIDTTMVTGLLSHIASELHQLRKISWIGTGYLIAYAAFQPIYGKLSDIYGRKLVLVFCNIMFGLGTFMCWTSVDLKQLVIGRVVSGTGGGGMLSLSTITLSDFVPLRSRGIYQGIGNIVFGSGAAIGGVVGGFITSIWGWRAAFGCQIPLVIFTTIAAMVFAPGPVERNTEDVESLPRNTESTTTNTGSNANNTPIASNSLKRIDFLGSFQLIVSLLFLMFAIATGGVQFDWISKEVLGSLAIALISAGAFIYTELHIAIEPVLPLTLLKNKTVLGSSLCNLFMVMSVFMLIYFAPIQMASLFNYTPQQVGYRLTSNFIGVAVGSVSSGIYMRKTGKYWYLGVLSPILFLIGNTLLLTLTWFESSHWFLILRQYGSLLLCGLGYSSMLTVTLLALIAAVPSSFQATTTSIQYTCRGVGSTLGVAIGASVFSNELSKQLYERIGDYPDVIRTVIDSVEAIRSQPEALQPAILESYDIACNRVYMVSIILGIFATLFLIMMDEHKLHSTIEREETEEEM